MIYVGTNVAKEIHYAAVSDASDKVWVKPFALKNDVAGFGLLLSKLSKFDKEEILIGLELFYLIFVIFCKLKQMAVLRHLSASYNNDFIVISCKLLYQ